MWLKERFDKELKDVAFSKEDKDRLKRHLADLAKQKKRPALGERLRQFWHGSIEVPLPAAVAAVVVLGFGLWTAYSNLLAVDPAAAALMIKAGSESYQVITQGVSVL